MGSRNLSKTAKKSSSSPCAAGVLPRHSWPSLTSSVCQRAITNLLKFSSLHSFSLSCVSLFEWFVPTYFFKHFKSCSPPFTTHPHHLPHYSSMTMVLTRCSIISQPNRVYTHSHNSLVPVLFSLSEKNTNSYCSIDCCSGFCRVCPDCTIFFLFHIHLFMSNLFWIIDRYGLH